MNAGTLILGLFVLMALGLGIRARTGRKMDLEQWTVGGRGFGTLFVFLLMAGEIYTTFTFLGGSGYAYGHGGPVLYILSYGCLAYTLSYWLLPPVWRYAKQHRLISQPDFFARKYDSPALGLLVAVVGVIALVPYLVLQLKGLGIIMSVASAGAIDPVWAVWLGATVITVYVMVSGIHGSAWTSVLKDIMILAVVLFLGIYLPLHLYGGYGSMFAAIDAAKPGFLALPARGESVAWFDSTVLLTALGFYMWPHTFGSLYTARTEGVFRKNAIMMPLYQLVLLFVFFVGFAAILKVPGLTGPDIDLSLLKLSVANFDPWFVGVIGGAGVLTALVPGAMILMAAATLLANNLYRAADRGASEARVGLVAKLMVPAVALVAVLFTLRGGNTIVALLLMGYSFVTQLFPSLVASLVPRNRVTAAGAMAGIALGVVTVAAMVLTHTTTRTLLPFMPGPVQDLNVGFVALFLNLVAMAGVSAVTQPPGVPAGVATR
jgi:SSS family solute:Na+ symporter